MSIPKKQLGLYPVMLTPFKVNGEIDFYGYEALIDWYLEKKVTGLFAVCLSSEMFHLTAKERIKLAEIAVKKANKKITVVACGGFGQTYQEKCQSIREMANSGVDDVVLPLSTLVTEAITSNEQAEIILQIIADNPDTTFGIYECPVPYKKLFTLKDLGELAQDANGKIRFLKDTCCDIEILTEKCVAVENSNIKIYNANLTTLAESLYNGCDGFSGIAANFLPDAILELFNNLDVDREQVDKMQLVFNTLARNMEFYYPRGAKEFLRQIGLPITTFCRTSCPEFNQEQILQIRDFERFVNLWRNSNYKI